MKMTVPAKFPPRPRPFLPLLFAACLFGAAPARAERVAPQDEPAFVQTLKQLAVKILRGTGPGTQFIGSGFAWVKDGKAVAITNAHVAQQGLAPGPAPGGLAVGFAPPVNWHAATRVRSLPEADLAIIETNVDMPQPNPYRLGVAKIGEEVYSISYDEKDYQQDKPVVYKGRVIAIAGALFPISHLLPKPPFPPDAVGVYIVEGTDCNHGASGSMLLSSRGELVAYNAGRLENGLCIAVDIDAAMRVLLGSSAEVKGAAGAQGATGAEGAKGAVGARGAQGAKGAEGAKGAAGAKGATGAQGAAPASR